MPWVTDADVRLCWPVRDALQANTGKRDGAEVAQLYLDFPSDAHEPPRQLKGFAKVFLAAGESKQVKFALTARDKSVWDVGTHGFEQSRGVFTAHVGASSLDLRLSATFSN